MLDLHTARSASFAAALGQLTGLEGLHAFTFAPCADLFQAHTHARHGVRRRRWCPSCVFEWSRAAAPLIDPLLWRFPFIECCPVHRIPLVERCPECRRRQPILTQRVPLGHCVRCGFLLTAGLSSVSEDFAALGPEGQWAVARAAAMARVLARSSMLRASPCRDAALACFGALLRRALEPSSAFPQLSFCALAHSLGIQPRFLPSLLCGEARPSLLFFLDSCLQLAVEPADVIYAPSDAPHALESLGRVRLPGDPDLWTLARDGREQAMARRHPARASALDAFIADPAALDLKSVARRFRSDMSSFSVMFPRRVGLARLRRFERLADRRAERSREFDRALDAQAVSGSAHSLGEVAQRLGVSTQVLSIESPAACDRFVASRERGCSSPARPDLVRCAEALRAALETPLGPTFEAVARSLGVSSGFLRRNFPVLNRRVVDLRERERAARRARLADTMRRAVIAPEPISAWALAARLGCSAETLRHADPALYARLASRVSRKAAAPHAQKRRSRSPDPPLLKRIADFFALELESAAPRFLSSIARDAGVTDSFLRTHFPVESRTLLDRLEALRVARWARARESLEREIASASPRSFKQFSEASRVSRPTLSRHFPDLLEQLRLAHACARARARRH